MSTLDTADILTDEDEKILRFIQLVKNNITYLIGAENIVNEIRNIIKESEHFKFRSKRNERIISLTKPLFVLTYNKNTLGTNVVSIQNLVQEEITSVFSNFLANRMRDEKFLDKLLKDNNMPEMAKEDLALLPFITSAIFSINVDTTNQLVYLGYVI